ncbi:MAG: response regulator transcription factor [Deltaproteobacteria bacterium]|nr:response regulator transcription factor [Deltaproteobacteria bacterium]
MRPEGPTRVLFVEDDRRLADLLAEYLQHNGLSVEIERDGRLAAKRILESRPDLVILDVMLPGEDGLSICRRVRSGYHGPILMLTARGDEIDQVVGLEVGADDYAPKPITPRLLLARIRALLRRGRPSEGATKREVGDLLVDRSSREARVGAKLVDLTTAEFDLLWHLAENAGRPVPRDELFQVLRGIEYDGLDRSMDVRVSKLREKIAAAAEDGSVRIKTVRGVGYLLSMSSTEP